MACPEIWDFLGIQVAQELMASLATQVRPARRWVLSVLWMAVSSTLVIKWTHTMWASNLKGFVGSACFGF